MSNSFPNSGHSDVPQKPDFQEVPQQQTPVGYNTQASVPGDAPRTPALSIVGLVLSIFFPLIGLIVSGIAWKKAKEDGDKTTVAMIGTILGVVLLIVNFIVSVTILPGLMEQAGMPSQL